VKRALRFVHWVALVGALVASALLAAALIGDDVHVVSDYGFGSGPSRHSGYGALAETVFLALPAGVCLAVAWVTTLVLRLAYRENVLRRTLWTTGAIGAAGMAIAGLELLLDTLNDRAREKEASEERQVERLASDHDALAAYASSHGLDQPLSAGGPTPLHAAIVHRFPDLVTAFVDRGAVPSEDDLTEAAHTDDVTMVRALLMRHPPLHGSQALNDVFAAGDTDMLAVLVASNLDVAGALPRLIDPQLLSLYPGEVDWQTLRTRWKDSPPEHIARAVSASALGAPSGFPASEKDVLGVLASLLGSDLCLDPALAPAIPAPWMRETRLCTCNYCPYARQINWAILAAAYPGAIPSLERSEHVAMLRMLARYVVQSHADPIPTLRAAVNNRNVPLLEVLEGEGFDVRVLDGEFTAAGFLELTDEQRMKEHLVTKGVRLQE
jgi:hypothetical protein